MSVEDPLLVFLKEPTLYSLSRKITEAREADKSNNGNITSIQQWQMQRARREISERYGDVDRALKDMDYTARNLRTIQEKRLRGRTYHFHDITDVWEDWKIHSFERAVENTELDKNPRYSLELNAVKQSHVINARGHLYAFMAQGALLQDAKGIFAGGALGGVGAAFTATGLFMQPPANLVAFAGGGVIVLLGLGLAYSNAMSLSEGKSVDPFAKIADTLEERAAYIGKALH